MDAIRGDEAELAILAMDLDERLDKGKRLPYVEMRMIAMYHPEDETKKLVGKAMVTQLVHGRESAERRMENLREIATEGRFHPEARDDACAVLRRVLSEQGKWGELASMALDARYPKKGREDFASVYLSCPGIGQEKALEILRCLDLDETFRQNEGMRLVDRELAGKEFRLTPKIADDKGMPSLLKVYAKSAIGKGGRFPKERKSVPPEPVSVGNAIIGARKAT